MCKNRRFVETIVAEFFFNVLEAIKTKSQDRGIRGG